MADDIDEELKAEFAFLELNEDEVIDGEPPAEDPDNPDDPPEDPPKEPEAPKGFMSKEAWVEAGKDPDEWVSPEVFKERTQRIQSESRLKRELRQQQEEFDNRLKNVNLLAQAQLKRQREELLSKRDDLIDVADKDGVRKIDKELEDLNKHADLVADEDKKQTPKPPEVLEWEQDNDWCMNPDDPRTPVAQKAFVDALNAQKTVAGALRAADKAVSAYKPEAKPVQSKKPPASMVDSSKAATVDRDNSPTISWSQLKENEVHIFEEFFEPTGMSKKDYLKTVADQRKGA